MLEVEVHAGAERTAGVRRFLRHYVEMVLAMAAGMVVFGVLFVSPLDPLGYRTTLQAHPYIRELLMLVAMTLPMVAFMVYRGHSTRLTLEMVAGMAVPTLAVIALAATTVLPLLTPVALSLYTHVAMLLGMLAAMLYRRSDYTHDHSAHGRSHHGDHRHEGHGGHHDHAVAAGTSSGARRERPQ